MPTPSPSVEDELRRARVALCRITYLEAVDGEEIYNFFGNRVVEHITSTGVIGEAAGGDGPFRG